MTPTRADAGTGIDRAHALAGIDLELDVTLLTPDAQLAHIEALQTAINALTAAQDRAIVAFIGSEPTSTTYHTLDGDLQFDDERRSELAAALHWSESTAAARIDLARDLAADLPLTSSTAATGLLSPVATRIIAEGARVLVGGFDGLLLRARRAGDVERCSALREMRRSMLAAFESRVTAYATTHTPAFLRRRVRDAIVRIDPDGFVERRASAGRTGTGVSLYHQIDGLSTLSATLPTEHALVCWHAIEAIARDEHADRTEPLGLRRARALVSLVADGVRARRCVTPQAAEACGDTAMLQEDGTDRNDVATASLAAATQPISATAKGTTSTHVDSAEAPAARLPIAINLDVTVDLGSLVGLSETPAAVGTDGIVPMDALRDLLADAELVTLRRVITDPATGHRLDTGVRRYVLTERERERILARDQRCRFPDCGQPATRCECDHAHEYANGGATSTANLGALCKRHHQCKTHGDWTITRSATDGSCEWRSPLGRHYDHAPVRVLPWSGDDVPESARVAVDLRVRDGGLRDGGLRDGGLRDGGSRAIAAATAPDRDAHASDALELLAIAEALRALRAEAARAWASGVELDSSVQREQLEDAASEVRTTVMLDDSARIAVSSRHNGMLVAVLEHALAHDVCHHRARGVVGTIPTSRAFEGSTAGAADAPPF